MWQLVYRVPGLTYQDVAKMKSAERNWLCVRMIEQLRKESENLKKIWSKKK
jgi:hypothetical protein